MDISRPALLLLGALRVFAHVAVWGSLTWASLRFLETMLCRVGVDEPPVVRSKVPIFGLALRLYRQGVTYYEDLRYV